MLAEAVTLKHHGFSGEVEVEEVRQARREIYSKRSVFSFYAVLKR